MSFLRPRMRRRVLLFLLPALFLLTAAACNTDPETAAYVGDEQISVKKLNDAVDRAEQSEYWGQTVQQNRGVAVQRTLNVMVLSTLLSEDADVRNIAVPSSLVRKKLSGMHSAPQLRPEFLQGVPDDLAARFEAQIEVIGQHVLDLSAESHEIDAQWSAYLTQLIEGTTLRINPRYGELDAESFVLTRPHDGVVQDV